MADYSEIVPTFYQTAARDRFLAFSDPESQRRHQKYIQAMERVIQRLELLATPANAEVVRGRRRTTKPPRTASHSIKLYTIVFETFLYWLRAYAGRDLEPRDVSRQMALEFAQWLASGSLPDIRHEKIQEIGGVKARAWIALGQACEKAKDGKASIVEIWRHMSIDNQRVGMEPTKDELAELDYELLGLGRYIRSVKRTPSAAELKLQGYSILDRPDIETFRYERLGRVPLAPSSVSIYLTIMSIFWKEMTKGENWPGGEAPVKDNIWTDLAAQFKRSGKRFAKEQLLQRTMQEPILQALEMSALARAGLLQTGQAPTNSLIEGVRDLLVLYGLLYLGLRAEEMCGVLRKDLSEDEHGRTILTIYGKGDKVRRIEFGAVVRRVFDRFDGLLEAESAGSGFAAQWAFEIRQPDAPIFPSYPRWGIDCPKVDGKSVCNPKDPLNPAAIAKILKRIAVCARVKNPDTGAPRSLTDKEIKQIHPHGLRHYFATKLHDAGMPIEQIAKAMGHELIETTAKYIDTQPENLGDLSEIVILSRRGQIQQAEKQLAERAGAAMPSSLEPAAPEFPEEPPHRSRAVVVKERAVQAEQGYEQPQRQQAAQEPAPEQAQVMEAQMVDADVVELVGVVRVAGKAAPAWAYDVDRADDLASFYPPVSKPLEVPEWRAVASFFRRGEKSQLPWWTGTSGAWRGDQIAPIMSPAQASPATELDSQVKNGLRSLHDRWFSDSAKGPTSAAALRLWVSEMLDPVSVAFDQVAARRGTTWIGWNDGVGPSDNVVREHLPQKIVGWFEKWADASGMSKHGGRKLKTDFQLPSWFFEDDPLLALPSEERRKLMDWLQSLQGKQASTRQSQVVEQLVMLVSEYSTVKKSSVDTRRPEATRNDPDFRAEVLRSHPAMIAEIGRKNFSIEIDLKAMIRGIDSEDSLKSVRDKVLAYLKAQGAPGITIEPAIKTKSHVLDGRQLTFNSEGTIVHSDDYKRRFYETMGTDSECVARRAARWVWEAHKAKPFSRSDDVRDSYDLALAYVVPCPSAIEQALVAKGLDPRQFDSGWARATLWADAMETYARQVADTNHVGRFIRSREIEIQAMFDELSDPLEAAAARMGISFGQEIDVEPDGGKLIKNASAEVPDPISVLFAAKTRI